MPSVPVDGRRQYSMADVVVANVSLGRMPFAGVEEVFPGRYVVAGSWPKPTSPGGSGFSGLAAAEAEPAEAPRSSAAARSLWPQLR
jgi:hypothetical protein